MLRSQTPSRPHGPACADVGLARLPLVLAMAAVVAVGGTTAALVSAPGRLHPLVLGGATTAPAPTPPAPTVAFAGQVLGASAATTVPWRRPLTFAVTDATISSVTATGPRGPVAGTLTPTRWTASSTLVPSSRYVLHAVLVDVAGHHSTIERRLTSSAADAVLHPVISPDQRRGVGVGQPIVLTLDHRVSGPAARAALLARLKVTSVPKVTGAWRFFGSYELHYRPASYWPAGATVSVQADLRGWRVPGTGTWGSDHVTTAGFSVGDSLVSTVDITAHTMTVRRNGQILRVLPVSTGRELYPTKGGVHIILTVEREHLYDSSTVGIPTQGPDGYYEKLPYSMRISNGGAFVHANPATVKYQGRLNVSHGCVNLSLADAKWFFELSHRGDVVNIIHAVVAPVLSDPGMADWNYSFATWRKGNLG